MEYTVNKFKDFEIRQYHILDSTNEQAKRVSANDLVIVADSQTAGKGRSGRGWVSDEGNLFFSIIIDSKKLNPPQMASYIVALAVVDSLKRYGLNPALKWPNDILLDEKKLCGILIEKHKTSLIIGIGININSYPAHLDNDRRACCLKNYLGEIDTKKLLNEILDNFNSTLSEYNKNGFEWLRPKLMIYLYKLNEQLELDYLGEKISGKLSGISDNGDLVIETTEGRKEYRTGEIFDL